MNLRTAALLAATIVLAGACSSDPAAVKADAVRRGDDLFQSERYREAIAAYRAALDVDTKDGDVRLKIAGAHRRLGRWPEAAREAILAADLLPANREAQLLAIDALNGQGRFIDATVRLAPMLKDAPKNPRLLTLFGQASAQLTSPAAGLIKLDEAWRTGQDVERARAGVRREPLDADDRAAEASYRRALEIDPTTSDARIGLASLLWTLGRLDEGAELLRIEADRDPGQDFLNRTLGLFYEFRRRPGDAERCLKIAAASGERESRLALADFYVRRGLDAAALPILDAMTGAADADGGAALRAADIEMRQGKPDEALRRADAVLTGDPRNPRALRVKAEALLADGKTGAAVKAAEAAVAASPVSREARLALAQSLAAAGDLEHAFTQFVEAWRRDSTDAKVASELAGLALTLGRNDVALELARQGARLDPGNRATTIKFVRALIRTGEFAAADKALAPLLSGRASPDALVLLAAIQEERGSHDAARNSYLRALDLDPGSFDALAGLVAVEIKDRQVARARRRIDPALAAHPNDPRYLLLAAQVSRAEGNVPLAESLLRTVLTTDPGYSEAALLWADVLSRQGRRDEAKRLIEQTLARRPSSLPLQLARARLLEEMGQLGEARLRYEEIVAANAQAYVPAARLAALYAEQGDRLDDALGLATKARQHLPNDPAVGDTLGWVYVRRGLPTLGIPHLEAAVRAQPDSALFRYHLGIAYQRTRQSEEARAELTRALQLDGNFPGADAARAALASLGREDAPGERH